MNDVFSVSPVLPLWMLTMMIIVSAVFLITTELRKNQKLKTFRIAAILIFLAAFFIILLRPSRQTPIDKPIILLTHGYVKHQVDSLIKLNPKAELYHSHNVDGYRSSKPVADNSTFEEIKNGIRFVLGSGIDPTFLQLMDTLRFNILNTSSPNGIVSLEIPKNILVNRSTSIQVKLSDSLARKMILEGPGGKTDSIELDTKKNGFFYLTFIPKQTGEYLYRLIVKRTDGKKYEEQIPIVVNREQELKILFVQNFPTFETQYLKTFLGKRNELAFRYKLSQDIYRYEFVNRPKADLKKLNKNKLEEFDLLFIDTDAFKSLAASERTAIEQAIDNGLGMVLLLNQDPEKITAPLLQYLPRFNSAKSDTVQLSFDNRKKVVLSRWKVQPDTGPLFLETMRSGKNPIAGYQYQGLGKVGLTLLQDTYKLLLSGDSSAYAQVWTSLIEKTSRAGNGMYTINVESPLPYYEYDAIEFTVEGNDRPKVLYDSIFVPLIEDFRIENLWHGRVYAGKKGWHKLTADDSTSVSIYVSGANELAALRVKNISQANKQHSLEKEVETTSPTELQPISLLPFYLIMLVSAGFLWLVPKL